MSSELEITLIIPAYNEAGEIAATLEAAAHCATGKFKEIIVVDNASSDRTGEIARAHGAMVIREDKKGLPYARAAGLRAAHTPLIAYIDADHHLSADWFRVAEQMFARYPQIVALSGPRRYVGVVWWKRWLLDSFWLPAPVVYWLVGYMILGGNFIARKSAIEKIGGFDPAIQFYGEDTDLARRLSKVGKVMFRNSFYVYASARRFETEGLFKPNLTYALNFFWPVLFKKPYTVKYQDVRKI